jgi:hypothetical protein
MEEYHSLLIIFLVVVVFAAYSYALSSAVHAVAALLDEEASSAQLRRVRRRLSSRTAGFFLGPLGARLAAMVTKREAAVLVKEAAPRDEARGGRRDEGGVN